MGAVSRDLIPYSGFLELDLEPQVTQRNKKQWIMVRAIVLTLSASGG